MSALNYTKFIDKVESGEKTCTIRAQRKRPIRQDEALHHFTAMRTKACRRLIPEPTPCREVFDFTAEFAIGNVPWIRVNDLLIQDEALEQLAHLDGFEGVEDFLRFFLPKGDTRFVGQLIRWKHPKQSMFVPTFIAIFG